MRRIIVAAFTSLDGVMQAPLGAPEVVIANYERAGQVRTGSFALDCPSEAELERQLS